MDGTDGDDEAIQAVARRTADFLYAQLRTEFPYMPIDALNTIVNQNVTSIAADITKQTLAIRAAKSRTSFLSLPPELRNCIYELSLVDPKHIRIVRPYRDGRKTPFPPLLQTCRQVRSETIPIYLISNTFEVYAPYCQNISPDVAKWFEVIGPEQAYKIKKLIVRLHFEDQSQLQDHVRMLLGRPQLPEYYAFKTTKEDVMKAYGLNELGLDRSAVVVGYDYLDGTREEGWTELQLVD